MKTVEQIIRDILESAISCGIVREPVGYSDPSPQARTAGDLVGPALVLIQSIRENESEAKQDSARYFSRCPECSSKVELIRDPSTKKFHFSCACGFEDSGIEAGHG